MNNAPPEQRHTTAELLDWAETLLCNSMPIPSCNQVYWHEKFKAWRDAKNALPPSACSHCGHSELIPTERPRAMECPKCHELTFLKPTPAQCRALVQLLRSI